MKAVLMFKQVLAVSTGPSIQRSVRPTSAGTCPPHPGSVHGMCIRCGASIGETSTGPSANVSLRYSSCADQGYQPTACWHDRVRFMCAYCAVLPCVSLLMCKLEACCMQSPCDDALACRYLHAGLELSRTEADRLR